MLTISISDTLAMNPFAVGSEDGLGWHAWDGCADPSDASSSMLWDAYAQGYAWSFQQEFLQIDAAPMEEGVFSQDVQALHPEASYCDHPEAPAESGGSNAALLSSMASPLRVPLPSPLAAAEPGLPDMALLLPETHAAAMRPRAAEESGLRPASPEPAAHVQALPQPDRPPAGSPIQPSTADPQKISLPTGIAEYSEQLVPGSPAMVVAPLEKPAVTAAAVAPVDNLPQGLSICPVEIANSLCTRVQWQIDSFCAKLQPSMGRPLVSPPFTACGLVNLRLMVFPDAREAVKNARSRERKGLYAAMITKGPLSGALKLKADCLQDKTVVRFNLTVGPVRVGPVTYDFSKHAVHGVDDFGVDWLKQVDESSGSLCVGVEILEVR